mgnify:CR=1 FL=1
MDTPKASNEFFERVLAAGAILVNIGDIDILLEQILTEVFNRPLFVMPDKLAVVMSVLEQRAGTSSASISNPCSLQLVPMPTAAHPWPRNDL